MSSSPRPLSKVPVCILVGFLGSGKTTLLNWILKSPDHGKRIAVIENEFGDEKGIERLIARDVEGDEVDLDNLFVELSNGCICCAVKDDLVTTLEGLLERRDKFDYIMIETSGVADPGPLAGIFWLDEQLESRLFLDGIICVVDVKNLARHLDDPNKQVGGEDGKQFINEAQKQIAYADRILLNKSDLVNAEALSKVQERVQRINPLAKIVSCQYTKVDLDTILNVRGYESGDYETSKKNPLQEELLQLEQEQNRCDECHQNAAECEHKSRHDTSVHAEVVRVEGSLDFMLLQRWIGALLWERQGEDPNDLQIFRIKGCVDIAGSEYVHVIQGVHESFEVTATKQKWGTGSFLERRSRIVFIGRHIPLEEFTVGIKSCAS